MKKKRFWKNAGLVALSGLMVGGAALAFTACGGTGDGRSDYELSVYIFCSTADSDTNRAICNSWAEKYSQEHADELGGNKITVDFQSEPKSDEYYRQLGNQLGTSDFPDIIYVSPSQVVSYAASGHILNLTDYITASQETIDRVSGIWQNSLGFYATSGNLLNMKRAGGIAYEQGTGFYDPTTENKEAVDIYGLPKDYSTFGLGYNRNYFSDAFKAAYTTLKPSSGDRSVRAHLYNNKKVVTEGAALHEGKDETSITYAIAVNSSDNVTNEYTGKAITAKAGDPAPFINIGIPTRYKPFNFYKYATYEDALSKGDPLALSTRQFTGGNGYVITIPGFPGEYFDTVGEDGSEIYANSVNEEAPYDATRGNIVLTWAEYGALTWACTYMLNSFAWDSASGMKEAANDGSQESDYSEWFSGEGGVYTTAGYHNVYGGQQYENGDGGNLYVLPWLFSNDATYINTDYTKSINETKDGKAIAEQNGSGDWVWTGDATDNTNVRKRVCNATEDVSKINLDGTTRTAKVQYGINSENFIETYGAFHEHIATWNADVGQAGDVVNSAEDKNINGQTAFIMGASLFYGLGTWDISEYQEVDLEVLDLGIMPTAVSNKLSLYAQGRSAYYADESGAAQVITYSNGATVKGTGSDAGTATGSKGDYTQRDPMSSGLQVYDETEIRQNQILRQDKWAGRLDSVGYGVSAAVENDADWVANAAVSLVMELTLGEEAQVTLTYGGAQIPNVISQCDEYLNYDQEGYEDGAFKDMITPEGDAQGNDVWDQYYEIARRMASDGMNGSTQTVSEFLAGETITIDGEETPVKYDEQYANVRLSDFTTAVTSQTRIAYAMRVLRMNSYTRVERDILIRMVTGMNAVHDQTLYTASTGWIGALNATTNSAMFLAYINQETLEGTEQAILQSTALSESQLGVGGGKSFMTPAVYCTRQSLTSQNYLTDGT